MISEATGLCPTFYPSRPMSSPNRTSYVLYFISKLTAKAIYKPKLLIRIPKTQRYFILDFILSDICYLICNFIRFCKCLVAALDDINKFIHQITHSMTIGMQVNMWIFNNENMSLFRLVKIDQQNSNT